MTEPQELGVTMRIGLHWRAQFDFVVVDPRQTVKALIVEYVGDDAFAWLEDTDEPLKAELDLISAGVTPGCHVHVASCRSISIKVRYNGDSRERSASPAATADAILKWAADEFKLTDRDVAKHELVVCGTEAEFAPPDHIGTLADDDCAICLDLRPKENFAG